MITIDEAVEALVKAEAELAEAREFVRELRAYGPKGVDFSYIDQWLAKQETGRDGTT